MHSLFDFIIQTLVAFINKIGYLGIFIGMFLESTPLPIPSELIMIPAGISASLGGMNIYLVVMVGTIGNLLGAIFSYYIAKSLGRKILFKFGKYFFIKEATIIKIENYFKNHGPISVFIGRLVLGVRHFISIVAGIAKMDLKLFYIYTTAGSFLWAAVLVALGYEIGENQELIKNFLHEVITACIIICALIAAAYYIKLRYKRTKSGNSL